MREDGVVVEVDSSREVTEVKEGSEEGVASNDINVGMGKLMEDM